MADFNPLSYLPDPKDFTGTNMGGTFMLPGFFAANQQREQAAAPFIQMAQQAERQKIEQSSQMNPLLLDEKRGTNQQTALQNNRYGQLTPFEVDKARLGNVGLGLKNDSDAMKNTLEGVALPGQIRDIQQKPLNNAIDMFSSSAEQIKKLPPLLQPTAYMKLASGVAASISDPDMRERFKQEFMSNPTVGFERLQAQAAQKYNTPAAAQARETANISGEWSNKNANVHAGATIEAARIRERGAMELKQMEQDSPKNAHVMVLKSRAWLAAPPAGATQDEFYKHQGIVAAAEEAEAMNAYKAYVGGQEAIMDSHPSKGGVKSQDYFRQQVKDRYRNVGGNPTTTHRPGPTPQNVPKPLSNEDLLSKYLNPSK